MNLILGLLLTLSSVFISRETNSILSVGEYNANHRLTPVPQTILSTDSIHLCVASYIGKTRRVLKPFGLISIHYPHEKKIIAWKTIHHIPLSKTTIRFSLYNTKKIFRFRNITCPLVFTLKDIAGGTPYSYLNTWTIETFEWSKTTKGRKPRQIGSWSLHFNAIVVTPPPCPAFFVDACP